MTALGSRPRGRQDRGTGDAHAGPRLELVSLIRILLLFESSLYSAVAPVLPHYAHQLHASKPQIGVLAAAYSAGLIVGAPIGGLIVTRIGVRRTTVAGLLGFGPAVAAFGFATDIATLDALRAVQGTFCGLIWCGGLTWAIQGTPKRNRSRQFGAVMAAAWFGTLLGPLVGTLAVAAGTRPAFTVVGALALALAAVTLRQPEPPPRAEPAGPRASVAGQLLAALRGGGLGLGAWLVTIEAMTVGIATALLPLRLSQFGASGVAIGVTFLGASAVGTVLSPIVGGITDRRGPLLPVACGLIAGAPLLALLAAPSSWVLLAVLIVIALGAPPTGFMVPAAALMTEATERAGLALVLATTLFNLAYASGETIGAPVSASVAQATSDAVPLVGMAVLMLLTLVPVTAARRRRAVAVAAAPVT